MCFVLVCFLYVAFSKLFINFWFWTTLYPTLYPLTPLSIFRSYAVHSSVKYLWEYTKERSEIIVKLTEIVKRLICLIPVLERTNSWKALAPIPTGVHQLVHSLQHLGLTRANSSEVTFPPSQDILENFMVEQAKDWWFHCCEDFCNSVFLAS